MQESSAECKTLEQKSLMVVMETRLLGNKNITAVISLFPQENLWFNVFLIYIFRNFSCKTRILQLIEPLDVHLCLP